MVKKQKKAFTINIKRKDLYLLTAILIFLIGAGAIIAYGGNSPTIVGHSSGEISGIVVGVCTYVCDKGQSTSGEGFYRCGTLWGAASCNSYCNIQAGACPCDGSPAWRCTCSKGYPVLISTTYTYDAKSPVAEQISMLRTWFCVTP